MGAFVASDLSMEIVRFILSPVKPLNSGVPMLPDPGSGNMFTVMAKVPSPKPVLGLIMRSFYIYL